MIDVLLRVAWRDQLAERTPRSAGFQTVYDPTSEKRDIFYKRCCEKSNVSFGQSFVQGAIRWRRWTIGQKRANWGVHISGFHGIILGSPVRPSSKRELQAREGCMTQAGYLSSHFHDMVAILVTARAIDVRGDPNLFGALVGRMLPIRSGLFDAAAPDPWIVGGLGLSLNPSSRLGACLRRLEPGQCRGTGSQLRSD
jgi:hypothetical protein